VASALATVKARYGALSRPARIFVVASTVLAVFFASIIIYREAHEPYAVLFSQLEQDDAAGIVAKLKELKAAYRVEAGGTTIEVPESKVADLRMELVGAGLPRGGGIGFESFDKMRLGATEFEQRVLYRRALEGELARTIGSLGAVQTARVHLVLPEKSVFVTRAEPASASIMLRLRGGRGLGPSEVRGIVNLTAAAVPGLTPDHVAVVTTDGQMLQKPRASGQAEAAAGLGDDEAGEQRALEAQLEDRARSMLEKLVGPGHVDVRVTAELDPARVEHVEDHYDPSRTALRSEELTRERSGAGFDDTVAGVPGAESNLPSGPLAAATGAPVAAPAASALPIASASANAVTPVRPPAAGVVGPHQAEQPYRESHTRNFEVDHVSDKRMTRAGALKRVGVAVIVDGVARVEGGKRIVGPRDKAELEKFAGLVRSAVGASDARGDSITVESIPFDESLASAVEVPSAPAALAPVSRTVRAYAPALAAAVLLLLVAVGVFVARRRPISGQDATSAVLPPIVEVPRLAKAPIDVDLRTRALERAAQDPATAALVLRFWLGATKAETKG
jgi:flagellar M-ring protein FliF